MSSRDACVANGPGGPRLCPDTCAVLASMSQSCRGFMTNRCPLGVRPVRFMRPVPNRGVGCQSHAPKHGRQPPRAFRYQMGQRAEESRHRRRMQRDLPRQFDSDTRLKRPRRRPLEVDRRDNVAVDPGAEVPRTRAIGRDGRVERPAVHRVAMPDRRVRRAEG